MGGLIQDDVQGFTPAMIFDALDGATDIESFSENLRDMSLMNTPTTLPDYEATIDVYDVFN